VPGTTVPGNEADPVPAALLTFDGKPGVKAFYSKESLMNISGRLKAGAAGHAD
jgi:hypothetical protein